jgi:hypothetical protein
MDKEALQSELDATYKSLDKADRQIKNLLIERKQLQMTLELLEAGNFITEGKLAEAREFVQQFKQS